MSNCIFCKIINGDFGTEFVYESESAVVFKDINPQAETHLLVVPRLHVETLNELNDKNLLGELMMSVKAVTEKLNFNSDDYVFFPDQGAEKRYSKHVRGVSLLTGIKERDFSKIWGKLPICSNRA